MRGSGEGCTWERRTSPEKMPVFRAILRFCDIRQDELMCSHVRTGGSVHMGAHPPTLTNRTRSRNSSENLHRPVRQSLSHVRTASVPAPTRLRSEGPSQPAPGHRPSSPLGCRRDRHPRTRETAPPPISYENVDLDGVRRAGRAGRRTSTGQGQSTSFRSASWSRTGWAPRSCCG